MKRVVFSILFFSLIPLVGQSQNIRSAYELKELGVNKHQYKVNDFDSLSITRTSFLDWLNSDNNNKLDGEITVVDKAGNKRISATFQSGTKLGVEYYWYKSGKLECERHWEPDQSYHSKTYYESGNIKSTAIHGNRKDAVYTAYYENGHMESLYDYSAQIEKTWYKNGQVHSDRSFKDKKYTEWYPNGTIKLTGSLNAAGWSRVGKWSYFDANGKLTRELFYDNDNGALFSDESGWVNEKTY